MIDTITKTTLIDTYFMVRHIPGWLNLFNKKLFGKENIEFVEKLDDELMSYDPTDEAREWTKEIERDGDHEIYFEENDDLKMRMIIDKILLKYEKIHEITMLFNSYLVGRIFLEDIQKLEKTRKRIRSKTIYKDYKNKEDNLADWEIARARDYPLDNLIGDKLRRNRMPCPFHNGKDNNFSVKNGYGKCFVCGEWADSIKWLMKIEGHSFVDAIKKLSR